VEIKNANGQGEQLRSEGNRCELPHRIKDFVFKINPVVDISLKNKNA
jgi:hypothetical protein